MDSFYFLNEREKTQTIIGKKKKPTTKTVIGVEV